MKHPMDEHSVFHIDVIADLIDIAYDELCVADFDGFFLFYMHWL